MILNMLQLQHTFNCTKEEIIFHVPWRHVKKMSVSFNDKTTIVIFRYTIHCEMLNVQHTLNPHVIKYNLIYILFVFVCFVSDAHDLQWCLNYSKKGKELRWSVMLRHEIGQRTKNIFGRKTLLLLIKASGQ